MDAERSNSFGLIVEASGALEEVARKTDQEVTRHIDDIQKCSDRFNTAKNQFDDIQDAVTAMNKAFTNIAGNVSKNDSRLNIVAERMVKLEADATNIKELIKTIGNVADQTSLIALNASVQAARVGEHGKTFRIVAGEVEKLAAKTSVVNESIGEIVTSVHQSVQEVSRSIIEVQRTISNSITNVQLSRESLTSVTNNVIRFRNNLFDGLDNFLSVESHSKDIGERFREMAKVGESISSLLQGLYFEGLLKEVNFHEHMLKIMKGNCKTSSTTQNAPFELAENKVLLSVLDRYGIFNYCNEDLISTSGFSMNELCSKKISALFHSDMPPAIINDLDECIKEGIPWIGLVKCNRNESGHFWTRMALFPIIKSGKIGEFVVVARATSCEEISSAKKAYWET